MNNPKILVIGHTYVVSESIGKYIGISRLGYNVHVLIPEYWKSNQWNREFINESRSDELGVKVLARRVKNAGLNGGYFFSTKDLFHIFVKGRYDAVVVEEEPFSLAALQIAVVSMLFRKKIIVFSWENVEKKFSPLREIAYRIVLSRTRAFIGGNPEAAKIQERRGYSGKSYIMPQLGVNARSFFPSLNQSKKDTVTIGYVGRLVPEKSVKTLLESINLINRNYSIKVIIVGSGTDLKNLRKKTIDMGINHIVEFIKPVPHSEVPDILRRLDILVLPSITTDKWKEQFGLILAQAMACRVAVIGSSSGAIPSVIGDMDLIFEEARPQALAGVLDRLISDPEYLRIKQQDMFERAKNLYMEESVSKSMAKIIKAAINE